MKKHADRPERWRACGRLRWRKRGEGGGGGDRQETEELQADVCSTAYDVKELMCGQSASQAKNIRAHYNFK